MAHFARVDGNNIVKHVCVVDNEHLLNELGEEEEGFGITYLNNLFGVGFDWIQTCYNAKGGIHKLGGTAFRKNFAGIGYAYDREKDAFIPPKPFNSWVLDEDMCRWKAPVDVPDDGEMYKWNEDTTSWDEEDMGAE
jgi:hypothetical protein